MHLRIQLNNSPAGTLVLAVCGVIAITQSVLLPPTAALVIGFTAGLYLLNEWNLLLHRCDSRAVVAINLFADSSWQLELGDGTRCSGSAPPRSVFSHPLLVAMRMVDDDGVRHRILIPADAADGEMLRRLRVTLRRQGASQSGDQ